MARSTTAAEYRERLQKSSFVQNVVGPKVLEPLTAWYRSADDGHDPDEAARATPESGATDLDHRAAGPPPDRSSSSSSLAAAQSAEAFFAGPDAGTTPEHDATISAPAVDETAPTVATGPRTSAATETDPPATERGIKALALEVKDRITRHNLTVVAAGIAFWALLAIPAIFTATLSIYGMVASPADVEGQIEDNLDALPDDAQSLIVGQLESVAGASEGGLAIAAVISILLALWTSSGAVAKLIATLNTIHDVEETRGFVKLRGLALTLTFGAVAFVTAAAFLLAILPAVLAAAGMGDLGRWLLNTARFPALLLIMASGLSVVYWAGPDRRTRYRAVTAGALIATLLWVLASGVFSIYTASFASYNETYGSLGAVVVLLMWLFLTAFMVLLGAEIDAARSGRSQAGD